MKVLAKDVQIAQIFSSSIIFDLGTLLGEKNYIPTKGIHVHKTW